MSLRFALLALLTAQPMTGYDLAKSFHSSVGHVWHAPDSQIYPELKRMEADGLVVATAVARSSRATGATGATKRIYTISDAGIEAFRAWMRTPIEYVRERDPAHLRAAYFEWTDPDTVRAHLRAHVEHWTVQREQWLFQLDAIRDQTHPMTARRLEIFPETEWARIIGYKVFVYEGLVDQADQQIAWAARGLALVDELEGPTPEDLASEEPATEKPAT